MTPTWNILLLVFVFWTYPATAALIIYRIYGSSIENVKDAFRTTYNDMSKALSLDLSSLRMPELGMPKLDSQAPQRPEA
jgi:hypothetical protein